MTLKNELGHTCQTNRGDDVLNILHEFEGSLTLTEIVDEMDLGLVDVRRNVEWLEADGFVRCDKEEPNWIVEVVE